MDNVILFYNYGPTQYHKKNLSLPCYYQVIFSLCDKDLCDPVLNFTIIDWKPGY